MASRKLSIKKLSNLAVISPCYAHKGRGFVFRTEQTQIFQDIADSERSEVLSPFTS